MDSLSSTQHSSTIRALVTRGIWLLGCVLLAPCSRAESEVSKEYGVKAAFLYNFTKFVEWPAGSFPQADNPIVIAVYGSNPFGGELANTIRTRRVGGRAVVVREVYAIDDVKGAHVLFVPATEDGDVKALLRTIRTLPVLSVGESAEFQARGGVIRFVTEGDKLRFIIDVAAADACGLKVSAQLLKLAQVAPRKP